MSLQDVFLRKWRCPQGAGRRRQRGMWLRTVGVHGVGGAIAEIKPETASLLSAAGEMCCGNKSMFVAFKLGAAFSFFHDAFRSHTIAGQCDLDLYDSVVYVCLKRT